jgi:hypothetical protein
MKTTVSTLTEMLNLDIDADGELVDEILAARHDLQHSRIFNS